MALEAILVLLLALVVANVAVGIACYVLSRTGDVPVWLRAMVAILLFLDIPPVLIVLPGMFGPSHDEVLGWGEGWRLLAIAIFLVFLLPGLFLFWSAFRRGKQ